ncbi:MAG: T9SS type A sorting domain-containing protein, partial [Bacteroidales bacterium]|nr:T9SS type A sorting domain-containing protein [Bacteroidales bacterium]
VADTCYLLMELLDSYGNQLSRAFIIQIEKDQSGSNGIISISVEGDLIYPNPADRMATMRNPEQISSLEIYEIATGRKVSVINRVIETIDVSGLPEGLYLVVIRSEGGVAAQKLLIQH